MGYNPKQKCFDCGGFTESVKHMRCASCKVIAGKAYSKRHGPIWRAANPEKVQAHCVAIIRHRKVSRERKTAGAVPTLQRYGPISRERVQRVRRERLLPDHQRCARACATTG
jgi:hypothetical protein